MEDLLEGIHASDTLKNILLYEKDILGEVYKVVKNLGDFDAEAQGAFEKNYGLEKGSIKELVTHYTNKLGQELYS